MNTIDQYQYAALEETEASLGVEEFILAVLPAIIRLAIEIGEKRTTLQDDCPTLAMLAKLIGIHPSTMQDESRARQDQAIHMARLLRRGLELADERQQLDGMAAVTFSVGYLSGEISLASLFASDETTAAEEAAEWALSSGLPVTPAEAYRAGFISRRDELRAAHQVD